jgi:hypothetical protein
MELTNWEFKVVQMQGTGMFRESEDEGFDRHINELGALGWELDRVLGWHGQDGYVVFRRPIPPLTHLPLGVA